MNESALYFCHFSGLAGGGMSALAQYLAMGGFSVSGSDRSFDRQLEPEKRMYFESLGMCIFPQDGSGLTSDHTALVVSTAIEADNPEISRAKELGLIILHRSEVLSRLAAGKKTIAVSGTSGKSTVTAMVYHVLEAGGLNPSLITGANLVSLQSQGKLGNAIHGSGDWLVVEADESDGSLVQYHPEIGVILNIEKDHQEVEALIPLFQTFCEQSRQVIFNGADTRCLALKKPEGLCFDQKHAGDWMVQDEKFEAWKSTFTIQSVSFSVGVPGRHNVDNALAAITVGQLVGIPLLQLSKGLQAFTGVERRFIKVGEAKGVFVVDDFAHNPAKVMAALKTAKGFAFGLNQRVIAIFHPHGFAPMKLMGKDIMDAIANTLDIQDRVFLPEIFYTGGTADKSLSSSDLTDYLNTMLPIGTFLQTKLEVLIAVTKEAKPGDIVISMGARDPALGTFATQLFSAIEAN